MDSPLLWVPPGEEPPPDAPVHLLREEDDWDIQRQQVRRKQHIYVHHGQGIRVFERDLGPAASHHSMPLNIPGCVGDWPNCESVHIVAELIEISAYKRDEERLPYEIEEHLIDGPRQFGERLIDAAREQVMGEKAVSIFGPHYRRIR